MYFKTYYMKQAVLWAAIALMMAACSSDDGSKAEPVICPTTIDLTRGEQQLVNSNNDFAFNLMRQVTTGEQYTQSKILSPISITYALGMLNNGAAGETRQQINQVLGFQTASEANNFCRKMLTAAPGLDPQTKVLISNTIFLNKPYMLKPAFVQTANDYYDAQPETRDFHDGQTADIINQWASDHTERMIEKVIGADELNPDAVSYLLNAIYFKGTWENKFKEEDTRQESFNGGQPVAMMHQQHTFRYADKGDYQALELPYGNGAYAMTILLPNEGKTIGDVLTQLTAESWENLWMTGILRERATVDVKLPRFETKTEQNLAKTMALLGMPNAFDEALADFPDFCEKPTFIGMMKQAARIKVNEEGTEAAAVTIIGDFNTALPSPELVYFHATRPFLYVISERSTGAIFFMGQYYGESR